MTTEEYDEWKKLIAAGRDDGRNIYDASLFFNLDPWQLILLDLMFENKNEQINFLKKFIKYQLLFCYA